MVNITKYNIKENAVEGYYKRLKDTLANTLSFALKGKSESGTSRSEYGYQLIAASTSARLARTLGANEDWAEALSMAIGMYFPVYGHEGLTAIKEYIVEKNLDLDLETLGADMMLFHISNGTSSVVTEFLEKALTDYYKGNDSCLELKIVRFVQDTIMDVKKAEHFYSGDPGELLFDATQEIIDLAKERQTLVNSPLLETFSDKIASYQFPELTQKQKEEIYQGLDTYIKDFSNKSAELEKYNKSPEEAVLIYIYQHY